MAVDAGDTGGMRKKSAPKALVSPRPASGGLNDALGHEFSDPGLLAEALTHRSAAGPGTSYRFGNERLEFLGDRVLGLVVAELLLDVFPDEAEGALARRFTGLVRREALADVAATINLGRYVVFAEGEVSAETRRNQNIQADTCEAVIGALFLDGGLAAAQQFILTYWRPLMQAHGTPARDAKTRLQEWAQGRALPLPEYREVNREGPAHAPAFTVEVSVAGHDPISGQAASKRAAEQAAAARLLGMIDRGGTGNDA